jgi:hypothetical protein
MRSFTGVILMTFFAVLGVALVVYFVLGLLAILVNEWLLLRRKK